MRRRMIFFDIDGTLVDSTTRVIPDSTTAAIRRARELGHLVYINSGRPICGVDPRVKAIGFDGFACSCGIYVEDGGEVVFHRKLSRETQDRVVALVRKYDYQVMYEGAEHVYFDLTRPLSPFIAAEKKYYSAMGLDTDGDPGDSASSFDKFVVWTNTPEDRAEFFKEAAPEFGIIEREGTLVELVSRGCTKGTAMDLLMARHGVDRADCVAIGDSTNDLPMLEAAGMSVAMGSGDPRIFDMVDYVTASLADGGIARALEHLGVI